MMKRALQLLVLILLLSSSVAVLAYVGLPYEPISLTALRLNSSLYAEEPVAEFSADPLDGPSPLEVIFTNESTGDFDECIWDYGDGTTSTECEPGPHTYVSPGYYTVELTVSGLGGSDTETKPNYIMSWGPIYLPSIWNEYRGGNLVFLPVVISTSGTATDAARPGGR
ncbi:MAG TPA: PKD domain-containing protein [Anaerolineae bacterium]|nr:PKD domain-containing protein [Anaerolineae bacterium]